jgi:hypothetical protein
MRGHFVFKSHLYLALFQVVETLTASFLAAGEGVGKGVSEACLLPANHISINLPQRAISVKV